MIKYIKIKMRHKMMRKRFNNLILEISFKKFLFNNIFY